MCLCVFKGYYHRLPDNIGHYHQLAEKLQNNFRKKSYVVLAKYNYIS